MDADIYRHLDNIKNILAVNFPHIYAVLSPIEIRSTNIDAFGFITSDSDPKVYINIRRIQSVTRNYSQLEYIAAFASVILHEILHKILRHPSRFAPILKKLNPSLEHLWNIVLDAKVNYILKRLLESLGMPTRFIREHTILPSNIVMLLRNAGLTEEDLISLSEEEIFTTILSALRRLGIHPFIGHYHVPMYYGKLGEMLDSHEFWQQEGAIDREFSDVLHRLAHGLLAGIGKGEDLYELLWEGIRRKKINWRNILRNIFTSLIYKKVETLSYLRPKKQAIVLYDKYEIVLPGKFPWYQKSRSEKEINIFLIVDSSGSISNEQFKVFVDEIVNIANTFKIYKLYYLLFTDGISFGPRRLIRPSVSDLLRAFKYRTTGGTSIARVFSELNNILRGNNMPDLREDIENSVMIVFSDGYFEDDFGFSAYVKLIQKPKLVVFAICSAKWRAFPAEWSRLPQGRGLSIFVPYLGE